MRRARRALALGITVVAAGCTIPITAQTITGGALNAGALLLVDRYNERSGEGSYVYYVRADRDSLAAMFEAAVERANHEHLFPRSRPPNVAGDHAPDGVLLARAPRRAWRPDDPPPPETFPGRQWTPEPLFSVRAGSPEARGDTLVWVVTHRAGRQAAFELAPGRGDATRVSLVPYEPPADVLTSVPSDHAQRNAVEALHQTFRQAVSQRLGPGAIVQPQAPPGEPGGRP